MKTDKVGFKVTFRACMTSKCYCSDCTALESIAIMESDTKMKIEDAPPIKMKVVTEWKILLSGKQTFFLDVLYQCRALHLP